MKYDGSLDIYVLKKSDRLLASLSSQYDQCLPQEVRTATLQGAGADEGRVGVPGSLRGQIPGPPWEAGTQADRALRPGWGNDEEGSSGERIETLTKGRKWSIMGKLWEGVGVPGFSERRDLRFNKWVGFVGEIKTC